MSTKKSERGKQISMGMKVEKEHNKSKQETFKIVMDHLREDPQYYTKLKKAGL